MKLGKAILGLAIVGLFQVASARADIPPLPRNLPTGKTPIHLSVKTTPNKDISVLKISRNALESAGITVPEKGAPKTGAWSPSTQRSIIAALAMSAGIAGVFLVRKNKGAAITVALIGAAVVGTVGVQGWSNAAAPAQRGGITEHEGYVVIEIIDDGAVDLSIGTKPLPEYKPAGPPRR